MKTKTQYIKPLLAMLLVGLSLTSCQETYQMIPAPEPIEIPPGEEVPEGQTLFKLISPVTISEAFLVGGFKTESGNMANWSPESELGRMMEEDGSDGKVWKKYVYDTDFEADLGFKFVCGPGWDYQATEGGNDMPNQSLAALRVGQIVTYHAEGWKAVYEPGGGSTGPDLNDKIFTVTVPADTPADAMISIAGNFPAGHTYSSWSPGSAVMEKVADLTYRMALSVQEDFSYKYTITRPGTDWNWDYSEEGGNRSVGSDTEIYDEVSAWTAIPGVVVEPENPLLKVFTVIVPADTPAEAEICLAGKFPVGHPYGNWTLGTVVLEKIADHTYEIEIEIPEDFEYKYGYAIPGRVSWDWDYSESYDSPNGNRTPGNETHIYDEVTEWRNKAW